ncbi:MAG: ribonuclease HII [Candidatus Caldarchaeum sp.]
MADGLVCGVDEAGRGCVVGPLVISAFLCRRRDAGLLRKMGVADSKSLSRRRRAELYQLLEERFRFETVLIEPRRISLSLRASGGMGLNELEYLHVARLIDRLNPSRVYVDSPDRNVRRARLMILKHLKRRADVRCMVRGDKTNIFVAAASVVAKVVRDREVERLKPVLGDFGSGYPSDPKTRRWLAQNLETSAVDGFVRLGWKTIDRLRQTRLDDF